MKPWRASRCPGEPFDSGSWPGRLSVTVWQGGATRGPAPALWMLVELLAAVTTQDASDATAVETLIGNQVGAGGAQGAGGSRGSAGYFKRGGAGGHGGWEG